MSDELARLEADADLTVVAGVTAQALNRVASRIADAAVRGHQADTLRPILADLVDQLCEDPPGPDAYAEMIWIVQARVRALRDAIDQALAAIELELIDNTRLHGAIRLGDTVYRATEDRRRRLHDRDMAADYVAAHGGAAALRAIWRLSDDNIRWTALQAHIEQWARALDVDDADDPERAIAEEIQTITDTLYGWEDGPKGGYQLSAAPVAKAKWSQALEHGQRDPARKPKPKRAVENVAPGE